jgi:hypothetical protein
MQTLSIVVGSFVMAKKLKLEIPTNSGAITP